MTEPEFDLVVVGAGPAGLAAAVAAAPHLRVLVVDEQPRAGGQIFRQPPAEAGRGIQVPSGYRWGRGLLAQAAAADITWSWGSTVFGILPGADGFRVALQGPARTVRARKVLLATGAMDLPVALPGWTLPGVVMAGAAQTLLKSQGVLVGPRVVLAGSHPLLILVADQLLQAGGQVALVALARGLPGPAELVRAVAGVPGHLGVLGSLTGALRRLVAARVPVRTRTVLTAVEGRERVQAAQLARVDGRWRVTGAPERVAADAVVLGYGFQPVTELARQLGCELGWDSPAGGWVVRHDSSMQTTVPGVYVAGEPTGVGGAEQAHAEGHLAGVSVVAALTGRRLDAQLGRLRRANRFARVVQRMFEPERQALAALASPETLVCRCEAVSRGQVDEVLAARPHLSSASGVKLDCRSGMGPCQGRYCEGGVAAAVAAARGISLEQAGWFAAHLPVRPVPARALEVLDGDEE